MILDIFFNHLLYTTKKLLECVITQATHKSTAPGVVTIIDIEGHDENEASYFTQPLAGATVVLLYIRSITSLIDNKKLDLSTLKLKLLMY